MLEKRNIIGRASASLKVRFKNDGVVGQQQQAPPRYPPRNPSGGSSKGGQVGNGSNPNSNKIAGSPLSVYLRVRPPSAGTESSVDDHASTVEMIDSGGKEGEDGGPCTTIRSYPPPDSNAAKVVRSHYHNLRSKSSNTDPIFAEGLGKGRGVKEYEFNQVFGTEATQAEVYATVARPLVDGLFPRIDEREGAEGGKKLVGQSALLFAYGTTNAGKTFSIMGDGDSKPPSTEMNLHPNAGVIPRVLHDILRHLQDEAPQYQLKMSYFEIYNEQIYDLLTDVGKTSIASDSGSTTSHHRPSHIFGPVPLKLRESRGGKMYVRGLVKHVVTTVSHGLELASAAKKKRHTSSNNINVNSSRSHCVCQLELSLQPSGSMNKDVKQVGARENSSGYNTDEEEIFVKKNESRAVTMCIVDLAGSERSKRTGAVNKSTRQKEAALINSSLMKLMRCLQTLQNNQMPKSGGGSASSVVPFRESKLTHLFMNHLTGASASRTGMIININPCVADYDETQHVLSFASVARNVTISETDYNQKWRAIAATNPTEPTHGNNGRLLRSLKSNGSPKKIAQLVKKLSPRSILEKKRDLKREQRDSKDHKKRVEGQKSEPAVKIGEPKKKLKGKIKKLNGKSETGSHQAEMQLAASRMEITQLRSEVTALKEQLSQRETEIRMEVASEMEDQMRAMKEQYNTIINRLKTQVKSQPTPGKSARKAQLDKAEEYIEEMVDKVDECEEEMVRMRQLHEEEMMNTRRAHAEALAAIAVENSSLKEFHAEALETVKKDLDACLEENEELHQMLEDDNEESIQSEDEERTTTPRVRRLRRERCSEVACDNVSSPTKENELPTKKRGLGMMLSKAASNEKKRMKNRPPLSPIPCTAMGNLPHHSNIVSKSDQNEIQQEEDHPMADT